MAHTPGPRSQGLCSCAFVRTTVLCWSIKHCPLHAAAPQLLKACEWALDMLHPYEDDYPYSVDTLTNAIRAAKGE